MLHLNRPHVQKRRADLLQCGPSQLAPPSLHILYLMHRNNQKMGREVKKNKLPTTTTMGNPLATAESQSLHHNVQPASKKRITCFYLQPPTPPQAYCLPVHTTEEVFKENTDGLLKSCQIRIIWLQESHTLLRMLTI